MYENLYKDGGPSVGDGHVNGPLHGQSGPGLYLPPERTPEEIEAERLQNLRGAPGAVQKGFETFFKVSGVDAGLGLVFGWGIVCREGGQDYYDTQKNHIPEDAMVEATTDFMKNSRMAGEQHVRMNAGTIVHSFPLASEIWKAMFTDPVTGAMMGNLPDSPPKSGWMVACAPDKAMLARFQLPPTDPQHLSGFSIGGEHIEIDGKPVGYA